MNSFDEMCEKASRFPEKDKRFSALEGYVDNLEEFINVTHDQTVLRLQAQIKNESDPVKEGEASFILSQLEGSGKEELSSMVCGSALVSVYFAYEASLLSWFEHLSEELGLKKYATFKNNRKNKKESFITLAEGYSSEILGFNIFCGVQSSEVIELLRKLRNSYVHNASSISDVQDKYKSLNVFSFSESTWSVGPAGVKYFYVQTYALYKRFCRLASEKMFT